MLVLNGSSDIPTSQPVITQTYTMEANSQSNTQQLSSLSKLLCLFMAIWVCVTNIGTTLMYLSTSFVVY